jgi:hypothetical protein
MSFRDLIESSQAIALAEKLHPDDVANWHYFCREYSKTFFTPLHEVLKFDPQFVITQMYAEIFSKLDPEEQFEEIGDIINSLSDPEFDIKRERAYREEMRRIVEEENERLERGESVHPSLDKGKALAAQPEPSNEILKDLPKSGGLNMDVIRRLQNQDREG